MPKSKQIVKPVKPPTPVSTKEKDSNKENIEKDDSKTR